MSKGKYSPSITRAHTDRSFESFCYNANGNLSPEWKKEMYERGEIYDSRIYFDNYDEEGYDSYGYSAFDVDGNYVGDGNGVDRWGYTEMQYLEMNDEDFDYLSYFGGTYQILKRNP